jgi:hypothetical protein
VDRLKTHILDYHRFNCNNIYAAKWVVSYIYLDNATISGCMNVKDKDLFGSYDSYSYLCNSY